MGELAERHGDAYMHEQLAAMLGAEWTPDQLYLLACVGEWRAECIERSPGAERLTPRGRAGTAWLDGFQVGYELAEKSRD